MHYYFTRYTQPEGYWDVPGAIATHDYRNLPQMANPLGPESEGWALASFTDPISPAGNISLGEDLGAMLRPQTRAAIEREFELGESLPGDTIADGLLNLKVSMADPTGQTRTKPLRGNRKRGIVFKLGQQIIGASPYNENNALGMYQADYQRQKDGGMPLEALRRMTDAFMIEHVFPDSDLARVLGSNVSDGRGRRSTKIGDTFNRSNTSGGLGTASGSFGGFSWTHDETQVMEVFSNICLYDALAGTDVDTARANINLSSDDHRVQVTLSDWSASITSEVAGVWGRKAGSTTITGYLADHRLVPGTDQRRLFKAVEGVFTAIGSSPLSENGVKGDILLLVCDQDDNVTFYVDGVQKLQATSETTITGNVQTALRVEATHASWSINLVDFQARDNAQATPPGRRIIMV